MNWWHMERDPSDIPGVTKVGDGKYQLTVAFVLEEVINPKPVHFNWWTAERDYYRQLAKEEVERMARKAMEEHRRQREERARRWTTITAPCSQGYVSTTDASIPYEYWSSGGTGEWVTATGNTGKYRMTWTSGTTDTGSWSR